MRLSVASHVFKELFGERVKLIVNPELTAPEAVIVSVALKSGCYRWYWQVSRISPRLGLGSGIF
jgi:hypothetical protein